MQDYRHFVKGRVPVGALVVRLYRSGGETRGFLREAAADEEDDTIFPSEEMEPEVAFRLAGNKLQDRPGEPVYVELEGVGWNPAWGRLV